nr:hypothetical protein [Nocardiopsis mwathae]
MPPPPPGFGPGGHPLGEPPASIGSAVAALIANVVGILLCWPLGIVGVVLAIIGLATASSSPGSARKCTLAAWIAFGVGLLISFAMILYWVLAAS